MLKDVLIQLDPTMSNTESLLWLGIQVCPRAQNTSVIWRHQQRQTTGGRNPPSFRTYLHPFSIDFHEQDTEGVGFGSDIPVQKVLAADGQLDFADAVLGADRPRWRGSPSVRHGLQQQQPQAVCGTQEKGERPQGKQKGRQPPSCKKCWMQNHLQGFPGSQAPALPGHHPHMGAVPGFLSGSPAEQQNLFVALLHK